MTEKPSGVTGQGKPTERSPTPESRKLNVEETPTLNKENPFKFTCPVLQAILIPNPSKFAWQRNRRLLLLLCSLPLPKFTLPTRPKWIQTTPTLLRSSNFTKPDRDFISSVAIGTRGCLGCWRLTVVRPLISISVKILWFIHPKKSRTCFRESMRAIVPPGDLPRSLRSTELPVKNDNHFL